MGKKRNRQVTKVNPVFQIPKGAEDDFVYTEKTLEVVDFDTTFFDDDMIDPPSPTGVETPTTFSMVSQKVHRANGNIQSVDIVFETDDIPNAIRYEIRVTKA